MSGDAITIGMLIFDEVEELDFVGPWEVFAGLYSSTGEGRVVTIREHGGLLRCAKGLRVTDDHSFADAPALDVLLVPGGHGTRREVGNPAVIEWVKKVGERCQWVFDRLRTDGRRCQDAPIQQRRLHHGQDRE